MKFVGFFKNGIAFEKGHKRAFALVSFGPRFIAMKTEPFGSSFTLLEWGIMAWW